MRLAARQDLLAGTHRTADELVDLTLLACRRHPRRGKHGPDPIARVPHAIATEIITWRVDARRRINARVEIGLLVIVIAWLHAEADRFARRHLDQRRNIEVVR